MNQKPDEYEEVSRILEGVYKHGVLEGHKPGSRLNIPNLPEGELTIATAQKLLTNLIRKTVVEHNKECAIEAERFLGGVYEGEEIAKKIRSLSPRVGKGK